MRNPDVIIGLLSLLALIAGGLSARLFPRIGRAIGMVVYFAAIGGFLWVIAAFIKGFGLFWGLVFGSVVTLPIAVIGWFAFGLIKVGSGVLEDGGNREQAQAARGSSLPGDVAAYIDRRFPEADWPKARQLLLGARLRDGTAIGSRLARCAVVASGDTLEGLSRRVRMLQVEPGNVIEAAECTQKDGELVRIRDLDMPLEESA